MENDLLKIGEFSSLCGISRKLLIYYDNSNILHPQMIDKKNGYRYYSYRQIETTSIISALRKTGLSLIAIKEYLSVKSPKKLIEIFSEQSLVLNEQIEKLNKVNDMIRARIEQVNQGILSTSGKIRLERQPDENLFLGPVLPDDYVQDNGWKYLSDFYSACRENDIQFGYTVGKIILRNMLDGHLWSKPSNYFFRLPNGRYPIFFTKPGGYYIIIRKYAEYGQVNVLYCSLMEYIKVNHLQICGNAYEEYLIDAVAEKDSKKYLLQISIQISGTNHCSI